MRIETSKEAKKIKNFKSILITGATSGLGYQLALDYAKKDVVLFLSGRNEKKLKEISDLCKKNGAKVFSKILDIRNKSDVKKWVVESFKKQPIDLVFANAGVSGGTLDGIETEEQVYCIFDTNIFGVLNTVEPLLPLMTKRKQGYLVLISSMASFNAMPSAPAYSSSKACVRFYGEALRRFLRKFNINVSVVCPGFVKTPMTDVNTFPMPFLMSPKQAVQKIQKGIEKQRGLIVFPFIIYCFLKLVDFLPYCIKDLVISKLPGKGNTNLK